MLLNRTTCYYQEHTYFCSLLAVNEKAQRALKVSLVLSCCAIQQVVQPGNSNSCLYNKTTASRFSVYLFPTFLCDELRVVNDVWGGWKKKVLNKMVYFFYFALQHCKWHRWQCVMTYHYVSLELFLPATSKKGTFFFISMKMYYCPSLHLWIKRSITSSLICFLRFNCFWNHHEASYVF